MKKEFLIFNLVWACCFVFFALLILDKHQQLSIKISTLSKNFSLQQEKISLLSEEQTQLKAAFLDIQNSIVPLNKKILADMKIVTITAYSSIRGQTNNDPFITASGRFVSEGTIAVSRDLLKSGWKYGDFVIVEGIGILQITDTMNIRKRNQIDIYFFDNNKAIQFGIKRNVLIGLLDFSKVLS